ncbi:MAG: hypothetical protein NTY53_17650, partial [Kiritimatiellaeota bacterium]|nr:hypothetical protein [Kiritimatiellota bacterium]
GVVTQIIANGKGGVDYQVVDGLRGKALEVTCSPSANNFPGVTLKPALGLWDLSGCGKVEAEVTNLSDSKLTICLRVDNAGDWQLKAWDAENAYIPAGKTETVRVFFGYSFGNRGYKLDPAKISQVLVFTEKPKQPVRFRIEVVRGAGQTGDKPSGIVDRVKPAHGALLEPGVTAMEAHGAQATKVAGGVQLVFPAGGKEQGVLFKCLEGTRTDLSGNPGAQPVRVLCRVENQWARKDANCVVAEATLAAGAEQVVTVPFWTSAIWDGSEKKSGQKFGSDEVFGVSVGVEKADAEQTLLVKNIKAAVGPATVVPAWVGQRPPVEGKWTKTFEDNFDGPTLDMTRWTLPEKDEASIWDGNG